MLRWPILFKSSIYYMFVDMSLIPEYVDICIKNKYSLMGIIWYTLMHCTTAYNSHRKNNCQKIKPAQYMITKRDFILRGSYFCEKCSCLGA